MRSYQELAILATNLADGELGGEDESVAELAAAYIRQGAIAGRVRAVLADFYRAPLSMSSVQPILDLAVELNPEFQRSLPGMTFQDKSSILKDDK